MQDEQEHGWLEQDQQEKEWLKQDQQAQGWLEQDLYVKGVLVRVSLKHYNPPWRLCDRIITDYNNFPCHSKSVEVPESNLILWEISNFAKQYWDCCDECRS